MTSSIALLLVLAAAASAFPAFSHNQQFDFSDQQFQQTVPIVRQPPSTLTHRSYQLDNSGQYSSSIGTSDGQLHQDTGILKPTADGRDYVLTYKGFYQYISPEGVPVMVEYTADENGFRPTGKVIPVGPVPSHL